MAQQPERTTINHADNNRWTEPIDGAFKGRGRRYLALLACPVDHAPLALANDAVLCTADAAHTYPLADGVLRLALPDVRAALDQASEVYETGCETQGRASPDEAAFKSLPQSGLSGYPEGYWARQASATALLWRFLELIRRQRGGLPVGPAGEAAVIGAGLGWLAYGLDVAGYTTLAIDSRTGPRYGLGVYPIARYCRVQADLLDPPLAAGAFDLLVYQDGLARSGTEPDRRAALTGAVRALKPGGWLAVMHALPVSDQEAEAVGALVEAAGLAVVGTPRRQSWRGRLLDLRDRITGQNVAAPPVLVVQKPL